jgi:hypothetical protein
MDISSRLSPGPMAAVTEPGTADQEACARVSLIQRLPAGSLFCFDPNGAWVELDFEAGELAP